jgi:DNA-binding response OmpR family regulator
VMHFTNGEDAWRYLSVHPHDFDLLLLDLDLPGLNGLEIARRARRSRYRGPIVVTSGRLVEVGAHSFAELKIDAQLEKPFTPQALQQAIMGALSLSADTVKLG